MIDELKDFIVSEYPKGCYNPNDYMSKRIGDKQLIFPKLPNQELNINWDRVLTEERKKALMMVHNPTGPGRRWKHLNK